MKEGFLLLKDFRKQKTIMHIFLIIILKIIILIKGNYRFIFNQLETYSTFSIEFIK